jgi:hypothetical protein
VLRLSPRNLALSLALLSGLPGPRPANANRTGRSAADYQHSKRLIARRRERLRERWKDARDVRAVESEIIRAVERLAGHWMGTPWGLGAPQSDTPGKGKINCGTFVGTVLRDAGFVVNVRKLQRQPSQLIIRSFVDKKRMKKFSNASMARFLKETRAMGPGLYIIGLDFHVGFLLVKQDLEVRFVHASYETGVVVNEAAASATPITTSGYRVIGKLLTRGNIDDWLRGRRIQVVGDY